MNFLIAEFVGTFILLFSILMLNSKILIAVGFLAAIVTGGLLGGPSHLNPVVSVVMALKGSIQYTYLVPIILAQLAGGATALGLTCAALRK